MLRRRLQPSQALRQRSRLLELLSQPDVDARADRLHLALEQLE